MVHRTLREVGLWGARHRLVRELSGGMKRRLSIGVALSGESQFIVVDEPTTGLDPASRRALWRILARARKGRSVLLTTHDMTEAETLATRIAIMTHGRLRCLGSQQVRVALGSCVAVLATLTTVPPPSAPLAPIPINST